MQLCCADSLLPYIGGSLLPCHPPRAIGTPEEKEQQSVDVVHAKWFTQKGTNTNVYGAPVMTVAFEDEENGNFWRCGALVPVPVGLTPYHGIDLVEVGATIPNDHLRQVLVSMYQFLSPTYLKIAVCILARS